MNGVFGQPNAGFRKRSPESGFFNTPAHRNFSVDEQNRRFSYHTSCIACPVRGAISIVLSLLGKGAKTHMLLVDA